MYSKMSTLYLLLYILLSNQYDFYRFHNFYLPPLLKIIKTSILIQGKWISIISFITFIYYIMFIRFCFQIFNNSIQIKLSNENKLIQKTLEIIAIRDLLESQQAVRRES